MNSSAQWIIDRLKSFLHIPFSTAVEQLPAVNKDEPIPSLYNLKRSHAATNRQQKSSAKPWLLLDDNARMLIMLREHSFN
jgi:hypothetical protein